MPIRTKILFALGLLTLALVMTLLLPGLQAQAGTAQPAQTFVCNTLLYGANPNNWMVTAYQKIDLATGKTDIYRNDPQKSSDFRNSPLRLTSAPGFNGYPRWNGDATALVFVSDRDGNDEIYTMSALGANQTRLTNDPADDTTPAISPDGTRIAFVSYRSGGPEIYLMNADGSSLTRLTDNALDDLDPDWSPDGSQIAWVQGNDTGRRLVALPAAGGSLRPLSPFFMNARRPIWSPKGDRLLLEGDANNDTWQDILEISADGTGWLLLPTPKTITPTSGEDFVLGGWSVDARDVYFTRNTYTVNAAVRTLQKSEVFDYIVQTAVMYSQGQNAAPILYIATHTCDPYPLTLTVAPLSEFTRMGSFNVNWQVTDRGGAPVHSCLNFREEDAYTGNYFDGCPNATQSGPLAWAGVFFPAGQSSGRTSSYRFQAGDKAGNVSPPVQIQTTYYTTRMDGQVVDNRGKSVPGAQVQASQPAINQPLSNASGSATVYMGDGASVQATVSKDGYGSNPPQSWKIDMDDRFLAVLPPEHNLLANGGFENPGAPLAGWQTSGDLPAAPAAGFSGSGAARLGSACANLLCVTSPVTLPGNWSPVGAVVDANGAAHVLGRYDAATFYISRTPDGTWSAPETLPPMDIRHNYIDLTRLQISPGGTLYFTYWDTTALSLGLAQKPQGSAWSFTPVNSVVIPGTLLASTLDDLGRFHLIYASSDISVSYVRREADGSWVGPFELPVRMDFNHFTFLASGPNHSVHLFYSVSNGYSTIPWYAQLGLDGSLSGGMPLPLGTGSAGTSIGTLFTAQDVFFSANGDLHFFANDPYHVNELYWKRSATGQWDDVMVFTGSSSEDGGAYYPLVGPAGDVHIIGTLRFSTGVKDYYKAPSANRFSYRRIDLGFNTNNGLVAALDPRGQILFLGFDQPGQSAVFVQLAPSPAGEAALSQVVTIPPDLPSPTLSFIYRIDQEYAGPGSRLEVSVTPEAGEPVTVFTSPGERGAWLHGWADLSAWSGQTVTIRLRLVQAAGEQNALLSLDEISLGDWSPLASVSDSRTFYLPLLNR